MKPLPYDKVKQLIPGDTSSVNVVSSLEKIADKKYLVQNISYSDRIIPALEIDTELLNGGKKNSTPYWHAFYNKDTIVPDAELFYQILRVPFELRDQPLEKSVVDSFRRDIRACLLGDEHLATVTYASYWPNTGLRVVSRGQLPGVNVVRSNIPIPVIMKSSPTTDADFESFPLTYYDEHTGANTSLPLLDDCKPFLEAILGKGAEDIGRILCEYGREDNGTYLDTDVYLFRIPENNCVCPVTFGCMDTDTEHLTLSCFGDFTVPDLVALGIRLVNP